ncbi:MAG: CapA family protein [Chloroflexota bacterium]
MANENTCRMRLFCVGDIAICEDLTPLGNWRPPAGIEPDECNQILFNFEFPIGEHLNPNPRGSGERFMANPHSIEVLKGWAPAFVTLANNHILDADSSGLMSTYQTLTSYGFKPLGAGFLEDEHRQFRFWKTGNGTLAILNWVFPETHPDLDNNPGANCWPGLDNSRTLIYRLKEEADWVIAVLHWSDELFGYPRPEDRLLAAALAAQGVDLIIGQHPHVVRGCEIIAGCPIFYSIGDFYFSDLQDHSGKWILKEAPLNRTSLGIDIRFSKGEKLHISTHSFWRSKKNTISDPFRRAERQLHHLSIPLQKYTLADYSIWYQKKRRWFDRFGYRIQFRLYQTAPLDLVSFAAKKIRRVLSDEVYQ